MTADQKQYSEKLKELIRLKERQDLKQQQEAQEYHKQQDLRDPAKRDLNQQLQQLAQPIGIEEDDDMFEDPPGTEVPYPAQTERRDNVIDPGLMQQPAYDDNGIQILNDIASDESLPVLSYFIGQLSQIGEKAQSRLITMAASFQSKNQVFSNIVDNRDYQMAQDDFKYVQILSKSDFTAFDMNADYFTAMGLMEAQYNIRLRRSRKALNLQMINTQRTEMAGPHQQEEQHQKIWQKVPFLGGGGR